MKILIIDDNRETTYSLKVSFENDRFVCDVAHTGEEGINKFVRNEYDLVILDIGLPDMAGSRVLKTLRAYKEEGKSAVPIIVLSSYAEIEFKVNILDAGADEYITKPYDAGELCSRVKAVFRRCMGMINSVVSVGDLSFNFATGNLALRNKDIELTNKEYEVFRTLLLRKGSVLPKERIMRLIYGSNGYMINDKMIDVLVCKIRGKLSKIDPKNQYIGTVWSRGYLVHPEPVPKIESIQG